MKYYMCPPIFTLVFNMIICCNSLSTAQIIYTQHFTNLLEDYSLIMQSPEASELHLKYPPEDNYFDYSLVISNQDNSLEYRICITDYRELDPAFSPHINFMNQLMHMASNEEDAFFHVYPWEDRDIHSTFGADWVQSALFEPKESLSYLDYSRYVSVYKKGVALVEIIILTSDPDDAGIRVDILRFQ